MFHPEGPTLRELMVQALSSTERGYDLLAPKFDFTPFRTPPVVLDAVHAVLAADAPYGSALDLCCGTGAGMRMLHPLCRDRVVGVDVSRGMLETGRRRLADLSGGPVLEWVRGDALSLPLRDAFDLVVTFGACGHILDRDRVRFFDQAARALRPGGRFVMISTELPAPWSPRTWLARGFNAAMHVRNALISPPFVMYYLTFLLPGIRHDLERLGLAVEVRPLAEAGPLAHAMLVLASRPAT